MRCNSLWVFCVCLTACTSTPNHDASDASSQPPASQAGHDATSFTPHDAGSVTTKHDAAVSDAGLPKDSGAAQHDAHVTMMMLPDASHEGADAGPTDAAVSGDAGCPGVFCENFETGSLNTSVWTRKETSMGNSVQVQGTQKAHGKYAAQFHAKGGTSNSLIILEKLPSTLSKHYFGRMYFYASDFPTESGGHTAFVWSAHSLDGFPYSDHHLEVGSYLEGKTATWQLTYWTGDGPEYLTNSGQIPKAQWSCVEWEFNDEPDQIAVWVNGDASKLGASFRKINNGATDLLMGMSSLGLGFRTWHPMGAPDIDVYIDDVVLNTSRVGCLP